MKWSKTLRNCLRAAGVLLALGFAAPAVGQDYLASKWFRYGGGIDGAWTLPPTR